MNLLPFERQEKKILIRKQVETSDKFGCYPEQRSVEDLLNYGIINVNKPDGPTSHQISDYVKKILELPKTGHSGTLDPGVTGVLSITLGKSTKVVQALLKAGKEYVCWMKVHKPIEKKDLIFVMSSFVGDINQLPPVRSAVKRQLRKRSIYYIEILEVDEQDVLFKVGCEAGTYIRKLCYDIGKKLGTNANMQQLIRTKVASFNDKNWISLHDLKDAYEYWKKGNETEIRKVILPIERAVDHLNKVWIGDGAVDPVCHGSDLYIAGISKLNEEIKLGEMIAVMTLKNELVGLGEAKMNSKDMMVANKGVAVSLHSVLMERKTYVV